LDGVVGLWVGFWVGFCFGFSAMSFTSFLRWGRGDMLSLGPRVDLGTGIHDTTFRTQAHPSKVGDLPI
jgi:hypothetical protein